jgi:hypothetical protein
MNTPMGAAMYRAVLTALLTLLVTGLTAYTQTHDWAQTVIITATAAITVLGGRGVVEGNIDTARQVRAAQGDLGAISTADVGAYSPPINSQPAAPLYPPQGSFANLQPPVAPRQYGSFNEAPSSRPMSPQGWQQPPQAYRREPEGRLQQPPPVPADAAHPLDARGI